MREIESEDQLWQAQKRKRDQKAQRQEAAQEAAKSDKPISRVQDRDTSIEATTNRTPKAPGFY